MNTFLLAADDDGLAQEIRSLLELLLDDVGLEIVAEDGARVLQRLREANHDFAFVPLAMRNMEALTLMRALGPEGSRKAVLLAPETSSGLRVAWECLRLGASDFLCTRGRPAIRLKGVLELRARQLAGLLTADPVEPLPVPDHDTLDRPWVLLPSTRHLPRLAEWLRRTPREVPVLLRAPEGPRLCRIMGEELARTTAWPIRSIGSGGRLIPGQIHLFTEPEVARIDVSGFRWIAGIEQSRARPGSWAAHRDLLATLGESTAALGILQDDWSDEDAELACANPDAERQLVSFEYGSELCDTSLEGGRRAA